MRRKVLSHLFNRYFYKHTLCHRKNINPQVLFFVYKSISILLGFMIAYLGYRLFMKGISYDAGDLEARKADYTVILGRAAPGTFFAVLGAFVIIVTVFKCDINYEELASGESLVTSNQQLAVSSEVKYKDVKESIDDLKSELEFFKSSERNHVDSVLSKI